MRIWVGIDDTDSPEGMCTTYLAVLCIEEFRKKGIEVVGFPRLIRLNPTIPFKTRGNGSVSFLVQSDDVEEVYNVVDGIISDYSEIGHENTNPGAVFVEEKDDLLNYLSKFANKAVKSVVSIDEAHFIIGKFMLPHIKYKKGRGLIGALSAVGYTGDDYTYELLAYRKLENIGKVREFNSESFFKADELFYPKIWDTVDWRNKIVVSVPKGNDPVLYGIRGSDYESIIRSTELLETEEVSRKMMFITNQSTDAHIIDENEVSELSNFHSYSISGVVVENPEIIKGGHVFFKIGTKFGIVKCSSFEPTKQFRDVVLKLRIGDRIRVFGSIKKDTLNIEKMEVIELCREVEVNPKCPECGKRMESAGRSQPFRCRRCGTTSNYKEKMTIERDLEEGFYEVPPCARRHLSKPLVRMNVKKKFTFR